MAATGYTWTRLICSECKDPRSYLFRADFDRPDAYACSRCPYGHITDDAVMATLAPGRIHLYLNGAVHVGSPQDSASSTASTDAAEKAGTSESAARMTRHDWRGTPIAEGSRVLFPRKWGRSDYSTEMAEGTVRGFTPAGRITVEVLCHSRPRTTKGSACYGVPAHSVTVIPDWTERGPWTCACGYGNAVAADECGGCHLTRAGQGEVMPPCCCGCDPSPGQYGDYDTQSPASRQHFIETGRFLRPGEILTPDR